MRLDPLCHLELTYRTEFHLVQPYGNESGLGWGRGDGVVSGPVLRGTAEWSNHPDRRGDGAMLPNVRGVIATDDGAKLIFELTGRTVFVERAGQEVGRQLMLVLFESAAPLYTWLDNQVCVGEGTIDPVALKAEIEVFVLISEL